MKNKDMEAVVGRLQSDWNFISDFLDNPTDAIKEYNLNEEEKRALTTRDVDGLIELGFDATTSIEASSGAHSRTCSASCNAGH